MDLLQKNDSRDVIRQSGPRLRLRAIVNGLSAQWRGRRLEATLAALRDLGCDLAIETTAGPGDPLRLAQAARDSAADALVVAGGDGTINEVINGLLGDGAPNEALPPLAVIPLGTANVLVGEVGLDLDPHDVAEAIVTGPARTVSLGRVESDGQNAARWFSLMAGAGFDAHVVEQVDLGLKARFKKGAYVLETIRQLRRFPFPAYRVTLDGQTYDAASVVAANARFYGGRFIIAPEARLDRPTFEVVVFKRPGAWHAMRYAAALGRGTLDCLSDVAIVSGRQLVIEGPAGDPLQGDGDVIARLPVTISLVPEALELVVPAAAPLGQATENVGQ